MTTFFSFLVALGLLIAVHEYGHYRMAVACGVKVLRFSIGFGPTLLRWNPKGSPTEFVLGAFPLGGYVKMLDEREGSVAPKERHLAFNTKALWARSAIVLAGPVANLVLAVLLYAALGWVGVQEPQPLLASPAPGSIAARAGILGGERVKRAGLQGEILEEIQSFEEVRALLLQAALEAKNVELDLLPFGGGSDKRVMLALGDLSFNDGDVQLFRRIGIVGPWTKPVLGELQPDSAAQRNGLRRGDIVRSLGGQTVFDAHQLRELIRSSVRDGQALTQLWTLERDGAVLTLQVTPSVQSEGTNVVGRIGAFVGSPPESVVIRRGPVQALAMGVKRTWDTSVTSLHMLGKMLVGTASVKNLSGPLTIADYAGKSASMGFSAYVMFLALISASLGVLNLLPLPVLDGGHLMYYLWEGVTGTRVSDDWMDWLQKGGVALLLLMMSIALFNDVTRLLG